MSLQGSYAQAMNHRRPRLEGAVYALLGQEVGSNHRPCKQNTNTQILALPGNVRGSCSTLRVGSTDYMLWFLPSTSRVDDQQSPRFHPRGVAETRPIDSRGNIYYRYTTRYEFVHPGNESSKTLSRRRINPPRSGSRIGSPPM